MLTTLSPIIQSITGNLIKVNERELDGLKYTPGPYLCALEIKLLSWLLQHFPGDYIEIGVNEGFNAVNVCRNNPDRLIYGVDWTESTTMHPEQMKEFPTPENVGGQCKDQANFWLILANSRNVKIPENIGMVFIDGDHSYEGVKADTENVLKQVIPGTLIVWHDYQPNQQPHYRVKDYIDAEIAGLMDLYLFSGTWFIAGIKK